MAVIEARADEAPTVMIVVDGSGSMAGLLEPKGRQSQSKMELVRDGLRSALTKAGAEARIGLAAFGHRRGSCTDVEMIRSPEARNGERLLAPLGQIRPRGKGPLTLALREAAKQLPEDGGSRSLLLIHDGLDNCQQDVCAAAAELSAAGIVTHVVSVGLEAGDFSKMACLARDTGGRHFKADTADQLAAAINDGLRAASGEPGALALAPGASGAGPIMPPVPVPAVGATALHLRAFAAPGGEPLNGPLHWTVARAEAPDLALLDAATANPVVPVTPGEYIVTARGDLASASQTVTVHENRPIAVPVVLGAGSLRVRVTAQRGGAPLADALITIADAEGTPLAVLKDAEAAPLLPPGRYRVSAELGLVRAEQTITIAAGRPTWVDLALNVGRLQLTTGARDGLLPLDAPLFIIMEDDPPRGRREVTRSAAKQAEFALPPGTYYVVARQGSVEARERLEIGPGDVVRRTLTASVGRLELSTMIPAPVLLADSLVSYTITRLDDPDQGPVTTSQPTPGLLLPVGRYRVEGRYGVSNVAAVRDIEIKAGQTLQLPIEHQAALLRLRLAGAGAGQAEVTWEVRDETGRPVWSGSGPGEAATVVQAGRYTVSADTRARADDRTVELRAGDARLVEFRAE